MRKRVQPGRLDQLLGAGASHVLGQVEEKTGLNGLTEGVQPLVEAGLNNLGVRSKPLEISPAVRAMWALAQKMGSQK